jgi:MFS family permease
MATRAVRRVVAASFLALLAISGGTYYSVPVYLQSLTTTGGLPLGAISAGTSIQFLFGSFAGLLVARWVTRHDPRPVVFLAGVIGAASITYLGHATQVWQAYVAYAGFGLAFNALGSGPATVAVLRHADPDARARTLAISSMGISLGGVVFAPLASAAISAWGLQTAAPVLGLLVFAVVAVATLVLMPPSPAPPRPEDNPPVADPSEGDPAALQEEVGLPRVRDVPFHEALRSPALWFIVASCFFFFAAQVGSITHIVRLSTEHGLGISSIVVAIITATAVVARFLGSWAIERFTLWPWVVTVYALQSTGLLVFGLAQTTQVAVVAALITGLAIGNGPIITPLMVVETFGLLDYPRLLAVQQIVGAFGQALGPISITLVHDRFGGYTAAYVMIAVVGYLAVGLGILAARASRRLHREISAPSIPRRPSGSAR